MPEKTLAALLELLPGAQVYSSAASAKITLRHATADSRQVKAGSLFICLRGAHTDGHRYISQALAAGAVAVLAEEMPVAAASLPDDAALVIVPDTRLAMRQVVPWFYDYPGRQLRLIGVTGTNGKTTTTTIIQRILETAGHRAGLIGTINIVIGGEILTSHNTTPDVVELEQTLTAMSHASCDYAVLEVSSHALALGRVAGLEFDCAVLSNITQDHLDFHQTMEAYRDAKSLLFESLGAGTKPNKHAIFNNDDPSTPLLRSRVKVPVITYGLGADNDIYPLRQIVQASGLTLTLATPAGQLELTTQLTGTFNVYNVMAAVAAALAEGIAPAAIQKALAAFSGVPGRFEAVRCGQDYTVLVDYAHTPDGLENVLIAARALCSKRLWVVFGCGGDRDATKRPLMGAIALRLADDIVVTSDNPRSEDPELILDAVSAAFTEVPDAKTVTRIADRRAAIEYALSRAQAGDVVLIAGKGHENYQILKDRTIHFDDKEVVQAYWEGKQK